MHRSLAAVGWPADDKSPTEDLWRFPEHSKVRTSSVGCVAISHPVKTGREFKPGHADAVTEETA